MVPAWLLGFCLPSGHGSRGYRSGAVQRFPIGTRSGGNVRRRLTAPLRSSAVEGLFCKLRFGLIGLIRPKPFQSRHKSRNYCIHLLRNYRSALDRNRCKIRIGLRCLPILPRHARRNFRKSDSHFPHTEYKKNVRAPSNFRIELVAYQISSSIEVKQQFNVIGPLQPSFCLLVILFAIGVNRLHAQPEHISLLAEVLRNGSNTVLCNWVRHFVAEAVEKPGCDVPAGIMPICFGSPLSFSDYNDTGCRNSSYDAYNPWLDPFKAGQAYEGGSSTCC